MKFMKLKYDNRLKSKNESKLTAAEPFTFLPIFIYIKLYNTKNIYYIRKKTEFYSLLFLL